MKLKLLLLFFGLANILWAQEPYRNLIFTEAYTIDGDYNEVYYEITNMGDSNIDLSEIQFAHTNALTITDYENDPWPADPYRSFFVPESVSKVLEPGESYVMTIALDFGLNMFNARIPEYGNANRAKRHDIYEYADFLAHRREKNDTEAAKYPYIKDSVTIDPDSLWFVDDLYIATIGFTHRRNHGLFMAHQYGEADSLRAPIDNVGATFDNGGSTAYEPHDVAGVADAMATALIVRKYTIKTGNLDFNHGRGVNAEESEWMAIPYPLGTDNWRDTWWTVQNHGPYVLDENTLKPKTSDITVDFGNKTITVPWGTKRLDGIMRQMERTPGVAWVYNLYCSREDSLLRTVQPGDSLTVYVCGEELHQATFSLKVNEPTADCNIVVPIDHANLSNAMFGGPVSNNVQNGLLGWPRVTNNEDNTGIITGAGYGLPNELRADSLLKYLELPSKASMKIVLKDGDTRPNLRTGDKLIVTPESGTAREYTIEVQSYTPSHNANLASITWPDISLDPFTQIINGWIGDTIPYFTTGSLDYRVSLPADVEDIPALVSKVEQSNASVKVKRAISFEGGQDERTISFTVTAEDDSVTNTYNVEFLKEKLPVHTQPFKADPFVSELAFKMEGNNCFLEICNPGTEPIDLSNYMIVGGKYATHVDAIQANAGEDNWMNRYEKYVPGYKWIDSAAWRVTPSRLTVDLNVPKMLAGGDVFVMAIVQRDRHVLETLGYPGDGIWPAIQQSDVLFSNGVEGEFGTIYNNPWNEPIGQALIPNAWGENIFLLKIVGDSVVDGLKPATDPADFELIEALAMADNTRWYVAGEQSKQRWRIQRKPEFIHGNPISEASFGTNEDDSEWVVANTTILTQQGVASNVRVFVLESDVGLHFYDFPTTYKSTVTAIIYKVSKGYGLNESIEGILSETTVADFFGNLYKADEGATLAVKSAADGSELAMEAILNLNDTLVVTSADGVNTTKYVLNISSIGLSDDALITSTQYLVNVGQQPATDIAGIGTLGGFDYGTLLKTVLDNITVPVGATLTVIDAEGAYVPLKMLNLNNEYFDAVVNEGIYLSVVAENTVTEIIYQLKPSSSVDDAFIVSEVYSVDQDKMLINYVPGNTNVNTLLSNLIPSAGATMVVTDKMRNVRTEGTITVDDKVVVTSESGKNAVYYISLLATDLRPATTYLAYILSKDNAIAIDQADYVITGATKDEAVSAFLAKVEPVLGATVVVLDANGNEKTGGIQRTDLVKVTSVDGMVSVVYTFGSFVSVELTAFNQIQLFPNPTDSRITVKGINEGSHIKIYNASGVVVRNVISHSQEKVISLEGEKTGLYLIVISNNDKVLGRYKVLKK